MQEKQLANDERDDCRVSTSQKALHTSAVDIIPQQAPNRERERKRDGFRETEEGARGEGGEKGDREKKQGQSRP